MRSSPDVSLGLKPLAFALAYSLVGSLAGLGAANAQSVEDFYKGRTVEVVIGLSAGGGYDVYARLVARHMAAHIPGKPQIVAKQMTGGGSRVAANYGYNIASKDGTVLVMPDQSLPLQQALGDPTVKFDSTKLNWIGNPIADNNTLSAWHTTGVTRWEQARERVLSLGATGPNTSAWYGQAMNVMVGTKFKIIMGYPGGNEINLALEKGEVDIRGSNSWSSWKVTRPDWVIGANKKLNVLVQIGLKRDPQLPDVPLLMELPSDANDKAALRLLSAPTTIGRPLFAPPNVPVDRVKALRAAFDATMKDAAFIEEAKKLKLDLLPVSGEELQKIVEEIVATPPGVVERLKVVLEIK
jgi:tripartite-type tricarboxylate transporter receptor subunit TctC